MSSNQNSKEIKKKSHVNTRVNTENNHDIEKTMLQLVSFTIIYTFALQRGGGKLKEQEAIEGGETGRLKNGQSYVQQFVADYI